MIIEKHLNYGNNGQRHHVCSNYHRATEQKCAQLSAATIVASNRIKCDGH